MREEKRAVRDQRSEGGDRRSEVIGLRPFEVRGRKACGVGGLRLEAKNMKLN
jgi:hypothetical protein